MKIKSEATNLTSLFVISDKDINDDVIIINNEIKNYIEGDVVKVIRYPTDGTILNLYIKKSPDIIHDVGIISSNNFRKLGLDINDDTITIFKPNN